MLLAHQTARQKAEAAGEPIFDEDLDQVESLQPASSDFSWLLWWLSHYPISVRTKLVLVFLIPLLLLGTRYIAKIGTTAGATFLVFGSFLVMLCLLWIFGMPFRDGPKVGFACLLRGYRRRLWFEQNFHGVKHRLGRLAGYGIVMLALSCAFFYVAELTIQRAREQAGLIDRSGTRLIQK
jgi:hypothetical protein